MKSFATLFVVSFLLYISDLKAQDISPNDSIVYKAIVEADFNSLNAKLESNHDAQAKSYFQGMIFALNEQTNEAIKTLTEAAIDSTSPYSPAAKKQLLKVLFNSENYKAYCQYAELFNDKSAWFEDALLYSSFPSKEVEFLAKKDTIQFILRRKNFVIIKILINGYPARFIIDTGCSQTIISDRLAKRMGIKITQTKSPVVTATNQLITGGSALIERVSIKNLAIKNLPVKSFTTIFGFPISLILGRIDGLIGLDILKHLRYTIDFKKRHCIIEKPVSQQVPIRKNLFYCNEALVTQTTVDNKPLYLFYDSGSNGFQFSRFAKNQVIGHTAKKKKHYNFGINKTFLIEHSHQIKHFKFKSGHYLLEAQKAVLTNQECWIMNVPIHAIVGNKPFHKGSLTIDFPNGEFSYSKN